MAGITHLEEFQAPALRALVDLTEENAEETFADAYLPTEQTYSRTFAYDIIKTNQYIASYIGYGSEAPYIDRNAVASKMGEIAYFGLNDMATYEELQAIHEARNDSEKSAVIDALIMKNVNILNGLRRLIYVAKMEALFKGVHNFGKVDGEKNQVYFDYGVPASNKVALTAGADFEEPTFDIIAFIETQVKAYKEANGGKAPEVMVGSAEIRGMMQRNPNIITEAGRPEGSTRVSVAQLNEVLSDYGLPSFSVIEERTVTYMPSGSLVSVEKELVPVNRLTFLSKGIGSYLEGPTLENNFQPGLFLRVRDKEDPIRTIINGWGAGFPKPEQPSLIFYMDVFTP